VIDKNDLEVIVWRSDDPDRVMQELWVKLVHKPTGISAESREHATQPENYAAALAELQRKVAERTED
jgi:protein subunit release factor A